VKPTNSLRPSAAGRARKKLKKGAQSRQAAKSAAAESHTERTSISLRPPRWAGFCEKKKRKNKSREAAKPPRIGNYSFAALRLSEKK
jgi:hypothetical protein